MLVLGRHLRLLFLVGVENQIAQSVLTARVESQLRDMSKTLRIFIYILRHILDFCAACNTDFNYQTQR